MGPWELASVLESSLAGGGRVILVAPSAGLGARFGTAAILAPDLAGFAHVGRSDAPSVAVSGAGVPERHCFAGREVLVVADGPAAREVLLETRGSGRSWWRATTRSSLRCVPRSGTPAARPTRLSRRVGWQAGWQGGAQGRARVASSLCWAHCRTVSRPSRPPNVSTWRSFRHSARRVNGSGEQQRSPGRGTSSRSSGRPGRAVRIARRGAPERRRSRPSASAGRSTTTSMPLGIEARCDP